MRRILTLAVRRSSSMAYLLMDDGAIRPALPADIDGFSRYRAHSILNAASHELPADGHLGEEGRDDDGERRTAYNRRGCRRDSPGRPVRSDARQSVPDHCLYRRQDAPAPHSVNRRRPGPRGNDSLRSVEGEDRLSREGRRHIVWAQAAGASTVTPSERTDAHGTQGAVELGPLLSRRFTTFGADPKRSIFQLITTATPFIALLAVMVWASNDLYWLTLLLAIPAAGLLVRLFIIQHDCGHSSFFRSRAANDLVGRALSVWTLTPYYSRKRDHAAHHASTGNLDRRGRGDVETLTVAEYQSSSPLKKLAYRLFRNPFGMVLVGAPVNFILLQRFPKGHELRCPQSRRSILLLDLGLFVAFGIP